MDRRLTVEVAVIPKGKPAQVGWKRGKGRGRGRGKGEGR